jgi:hypothetical protein
MSELKDDLSGMSLAELEKIKTSAESLTPLQGIHKFNKSEITKAIGNTSFNDILKSFKNEMVQTNLKSLLEKLNEIPGFNANHYNIIVK